MRPAEEADHELLFRIYASTRATEMAVVGWSEERTEALLRQQFGAQSRHYRHQYPGAELSIVMLGSEPIGRLHVDRRVEEIRVVDIALLPEGRGKGIGSELIRRVLAEGKAAGTPVRIHVERSSRALGFYRRFGFRVIRDDGVHLFMELSPESTRSDPGRD